MPRQTVDETAASELAQYAVNDGEIYRSNTVPIITNLAKKIAGDKYDGEKAIKLWVYNANLAAQKYAWEFGTRKRGTRSWREQGIDGNGLFNLATRTAAARDIAEHWNEQVREEAAKISAARGAKKRKNPVKDCSVCGGTGTHGRTVRGEWRIGTCRKCGGAGVVYTQPKPKIGLGAAGDTHVRMPSSHRRNAGARKKAQPYNGHPSRAHWNVALWVNNTEGLYRMAMRMKKKDFMEELPRIYPKTGDGVKVTKTLAGYAWSSAR